MDICKKCSKEFQGKYCPNCGHPQKLERINGHYIMAEMGSLLNFEKGFFHTVKELLIRPGQNIRQYISEDRSRLVKPIMFIIICSLFYTLSVQTFEVNDQYLDFQIEFDNADNAMNQIFQWISQNYGYSNILMSLFVAFWIKVFYRKYDYNFYEILILLLFLSGMQMLMFTFLAILVSLTKIGALSFLSKIISIYAFWATANFFDKRKVWNYLKAPITYFLGFITFVIVILGVGFIIDLIR